MSEHTSSKKQDKDMFWKVTTIILIAVLAIIAFRGGAGTQVAAPSAGQADAPSAAAAPSIDIEELVDDDSVLGDPNAPVTIVEFSDYECPFCARFHADTLSQIKENYIDTGKVKLVYRDYPLSFHANALPAAIAAECAGDQDMYYEYHDLLFENQGSLGDALYIQLAEQLSLDMDAFASCRTDSATRAEVQKDFSDGQAAGVQGTPAFFVNGIPISGAVPYQVFEQAIEASLQ